MFYAIFNIKNILKSAPFWLNGRWFLQIVERDSCNLYPLYLDSLVLILYLKRGGGGCYVFLTFYAISNISRKKNLGIQTNYFSFIAFFVFFLYAGNIEKCPFTYCMVKWEVVSPNRRYTCREVNWKVVSQDSRSGPIYNKNCGVSF